MDSTFKQGTDCNDEFYSNKSLENLFKTFEDHNFLISPKLAGVVGYKNFRLWLKSEAVPTVFDFKNRRNGGLKGRNSAKSIAKNKKKVQHEVCRFRFNF